MCAATALWEAAVFLATVGPLVRAWEEADDIGRCSSKSLQGIRDVLVVVVVVGVVIITGPVFNCWRPKARHKLYWTFLRRAASYQLGFTTSYKENNICCAQAVSQLNFSVRAALAC